MPDADATLEQGRRGSGTRGRRPSLYRNVFANWSSTLLTIAYTLVITPIVVRALHRELYGIWSFLNGLVAYSNLFYMGLGSALVRYAAEYHAAGKRDALNRLASVVLSVYTVVGLVAVVAMSFAAPFVPRMIEGTMTPGTAAAAKATAVLLGVRFFLLFVASAFSGVVIAEGRMDLFNLVGISGTLIRFAAVPFVVRGSNPLMGLATLVVASSALETTAHAFMARHVDPGLRVRAVLPRLPELRLLYGFGFFSFLLQVGDRIISYTDTTVIGLMLGAGAVTAYVLPLQLAEYARIAVNGIVSVLLPHITALRATGRDTDVAAAYLRSVRTASFVSAFLNANLVFLGGAFLHRWVGPGFTVSATPILVCLATAGFLQSIATQSQWPFCMALHLLRVPVAVLLVEAALNLGLSVALAHPLGIVGVAIGTAVPALLCTATFVPRYVSRRVGLTLPRVIREALLPSLVLVVAIAAVQWPLMALSPAASYPAIVARGLLSVPVAAVVAFALFPATERDAVAGVLLSALTRGGGQSLPPAVVMRHFRCAEASVQGNGLGDRAIGGGRDTSWLFEVLDLTHCAPPIRALRVLFFRGWAAGARGRLRDRGATEVWAYGFYPEIENPIFVYELDGVGRQYMERDMLQGDTPRTVRASRILGFLSGCDPRLAAVVMVGSRR